MSRSLFALCLVSLLLATTGEAASLAPSKPSQVMTILQSAAQGACSSSDHDEFDTQIAGNGSLSPFSIPAGMVFVVTSFEWWSTGASFSGPAQYFLISPPSNDSPLIVPGVVGPQGGGGSLFLGPAGVVLKSGDHICGSTGSIAYGG